MRITAILLFLSLPAWPCAAEEVQTAALTSFTEGPAVDRDGNVYFTDLASQRILKLDAAGSLSVYRENSNVANGLLIDDENRLVACEGSRFTRPGVLVEGMPRVTRTDLDTGQVEVLAADYKGMPFQGPNDVTIDGSGRLYFTDMAGRAVYRIDGPGIVERILDSSQLARPNGIQISPDDRTLYVVEADSAAGGARLIRAFDLLADGTARDARVHYEFYPGRSADGISIDADGNLYAAAGLHSLRGTAETLDTPAGVHVISPDGSLLKFVPLPEDTVTNTAFGGADMKTLFVTAGKSLYRIRTDVPGLPR